MVQFSGNVNKRNGKAAAYSASKTITIEKVYYCHKIIVQRPFGQAFAIINEIHEKIQS